MKRANSGLIGILVVIILIAVVVVGVVALTISAEANYDIEGTVEDKQIVPSGNKDDPMSYVIWLTSGRKLEVKADLFHGTNEDDLWRIIKVNQTYTFHCYGWHVDNPSFGIYWYPNVFGVTSES